MPRKYPTFFGVTHAAATGETLVEGYTRLGKWVVVLFFFMQLFEYTFAISGVTVTTAAILRAVFGIEAGIILELGLVVSCMVIVALDVTPCWKTWTRCWVIVFSIGTVIAAIIAVGGIDTGGAFSSCRPDPGYAYHTVSYSRCRLDAYRHRRISRPVPVGEGQEYSAESSS